MRILDLFLYHLVSFLSAYKHSPSWNCSMDLMGKDETAPKRASRDTRTLNTSEMATLFNH